MRIQKAKRKNKKGIDIMIHVLPSTLDEQKKYQYSWLRGDLHKMPMGLLTSMQVTTESSDAVKISAVAVNNGAVRITVVQGGFICAECVTSSSNEVVAMDVAAPVISATVEVGVIPDYNISIAFDDLQLSKANIYVHSGSDTNNTLVLNNDGVVSTHPLNRHVNVRVKEGLECIYDEETKNLTISMPDETYLDFTTIGNDVIRPYEMLTSVNGVSSNNGVLNILLSYDGKPVRVTAISDNWVEIDGSSIPFCPYFVDSLDAFISPNTHNNYLPLDDLYTGSVRTADKVLRHKYGGLGGVGESVDLFSLDTNIDKVESF